MKRNFRNSALGIIALAATLFTVPAQAQSWGQGNGGSRYGSRYQWQASGDRDRRDHDGRERRDIQIRQPYGYNGGAYFGDYDRREYVRDYDRRDYERPYDRRNYCEPYGYR